MKPIPYRLGTRLADWYHGWRDGRAELPDPGTAAGRITTPHRETLIRLALEVFEHERLRYQRDRGDAPERLTAATARLDQLYAHRADTERHLAEVSRPLSDEERTWRRIGDLDRAEPVVIQRRQTEQRRRVAAARLTLDSIVAEIGHAEAEAAEAAETDRRSLQVATTRVLRVHEYIHRRLNSYLRTLIRWHPDGAWAGAHLTVAPFLPGWTTREAEPPETIEPDSSVVDVPADDQDESDEAEPPEIIDLNPGGLTAFGSEQVRPDVLITAPGTAPLHFTLTREPPDRLRLRDFGHKHGPYRSGRPVKWDLLKAGDTFDFGDRRYRVLDGCARLQVTPLHPVMLVARDLCAKTRGPSGDWSLLVDMSFTVGANTLLAVLGRSGSGKSSLLNALIGDLPVDEKSAASFDGLDLLRRSPQVADLLGFVPQETDLHTTLTARQLLEYAFHLRDPGRARQRDKRIKDICTELKLDGHLDKLVSSLSGGQRRRVSIAVELLSQPELLILDEPTSGLDPGLDLQIMQQLRKYARSNKTVIVTTHATSHLRTTAHEVLVVADHGKPIFLGPPGRVLRDLGVRTHTDLMIKLAPPDADAPNDWAETKANEYQRSGAVRKAREEAYKVAAAATVTPDPRRRLRRGDQRVRRASFPAFRRQLWTLVRRQVILLRVRGRKRAERSLRATAAGLLPFIIAGAGALVAALITPAGGLGAKPGATAETALSVLTTLAMLSGQSLTYGDLVGEFPIIRREHRTGTGLPAVVLSKWMVFSAVASIQGILITAMFLLAQDGPAYSDVFPPPAELCVDLIALTIGAMSLGLLVSAVARKVEQAVGLITLTSILQIALNGVTAPLPPYLNAFAVLLPDRWGMAAAASSVDLNKITPRSVQPADAMWAHSAGQWVNDILVLALLTAAYTVLSGYVLHWRLRPRTPRRTARRPVARPS
jgi:ABC-type multidrug transport system ATPase subunit